MANIEDKVQQIRNATYGKDVRESIASGIEAMNDEIETFITDITEQQNNFEQTLNEAEAIRNVNETNRQNAEAARQQEEQNRVDAENARVQAEQQRVAEFATIKADYEAATHENTVIELTQARTDTVNNITYGNLQERLDAHSSQLTENTDKIGILNRKTDHIVSVLNYGAKADGITNDRVAIQAAIDAAPKGGVVLFPPTNTGYFVSNSDTTNNYLFKIDKPITLLGTGLKSSIVLGSAIPNTCDVFLISPNPANGIDGYRVEGITIIPASGRPARHAFNLDTSNTDQKLARMIIRHNFIYQTGGWSIYLNNPTIKADAFFTSQIENNLIFAGISLIGCGDSITVTGNTIAGYNGLEVSLVPGSNTFVFAYNNLTARKGAILKRGHNIKIIYNNFEVGYADALTTNNALLDIDGSDETTTYGMFVVDVVGNNFTYRTGVPDGIDAIRVNKARRTLIENNHIAHKNSNLINITPNAQNTTLGYNLYSYSDPSGGSLIVDNGLGTIRKEVHVDTISAEHEVWMVDAVDVKRKGTNRTEKFKTTNIEAKDTSIASHNFIWQEGNPYTIKHSFTSRKRNADGTLAPANDVMYFLSDKVAFPSTGIGIESPNGTIHVLTVDNTGRLLIDGTVVGTQS